MAIWDISFDDPWVLLALAVLPVAAWWLLRGPGRPGTVRHSDVAALTRNTPGWMRWVIRVPDALRLGALALFIVALARPQMADMEVLSGEGVDIVVALDMSGSMNAVDMSAEALQSVLDSGEIPKNRFEIARDTLEQFISNRREDRIGLVVFGQKAFLKFPLTLDYARVLDLLGGLVLDDGLRDRQNGECMNSCTINGAGTAIGDALARAYRRLEGSKAESRIIVLITDGKNEGGKVQPKTIADYIATRPESERVRIYTFQVGDNEQTFLPQPNAFGRISYQPPSRPFPTDPELLAYIAESTGGRFFQSYDEAKFREDFDTLVKTTFETKTTTQHRDVFGPWVALGGLFLLLEWLLRTTALRKFP